ncbi:MAG TPA: hypothetical protein VGH28_21200 [Polyangiaceae bacterium]|jgi:hypothetical protein
MTLDEAIAKALNGDSGDLYALLSRGSGLPGVRANLPLARAFAQACASDARGPSLARAMAQTSADQAPGGSPLEMIPLCGVLAAGACAARQPKSRDTMLGLIHDACDDLRFRVRAAVPEALADVGAREGAALLDHVQSFAEGYFHASALLDALVSQSWLPTLDDAAPVVALLERAFALADDAPRAAERWPGYKSLVDSLEKTIAPLALRFGEPVLLAAEGFARTRDPHLREMVVRALADKKLRSRFPAEHARALAALAAAKKAPRDPRGATRPSRKRGGGRRR